MVREAAESLLDQQCCESVLATFIVRKTGSIFLILVSFMLTGWYPGWQAGQRNIYRFKFFTDQNLYLDFNFLILILHYYTIANAF